MRSGLIFDFDGVILDTETPIYVAWARTFEHFGVEAITLDEWCASLGLADDDPAMLDPLAVLRGAGVEVPDDEVHAVRRAIRDDLFTDLVLAEGVLGLLDAADAAGVAVAIASSSPIEWIDTNLTPRGVRDRFPVVSCAGNGVPGKPDPAVYLRACAALGVDPRRSLAIEDSPNGTRAAKAAGLRCIATMTPINRSLDFSHADAIVESLLAITLSDWL